VDLVYSIVSFAAESADNDSWYVAPIQGGEHGFIPTDSVCFISSVLLRAQMSTYSISTGRKNIVLIPADFVGPKRNHAIESARYNDSSFAGFLFAHSQGRQCNRIGVCFSVAP
jgi:hypothetical protein